jgi:hypothetical protein
MEGWMRRFQVVIQERDDAGSAPPTQLAPCDLPHAARASLRPETVLADLQAPPHQTGTAILRRTLPAHEDVRAAALAAP